METSGQKSDLGRYKPPLRRIHIVRHGQTEWNVAGVAQGQTDVPLDTIGTDQAQRVGRSFHTHEIARIMSSDLIRARATAEQISSSLGLELELRKDLRERSFGEYEGRPFDEFREHVLKDPIHMRPPGGESFQDVWERLESVKTDLASGHGETIVVTHGGTGSLLVAKMIRATPESARAFRFGNTAVTTLERRHDGSYMIVRYNDVSHLDEQ